MEYVFGALSLCFACLSVYLWLRKPHRPLITRESLPADREVIPVKVLLLPNQDVHIVHGETHKRLEFEGVEACGWQLIITGDDRWKLVCILDNPLVYNVKFAGTPEPSLN